MNVLQWKLTSSGQPWSCQPLYCRCHTLRVFLLGPEDHNTDEWLVSADHNKDEGLSKNFDFLDGLIGRWQSNKRTMGKLKCCRCVRAGLWAEPEIKIGVKTSLSYFIAICFKTFWWWWTLRALVMIHRSEASMVWMQKPELSQMRIIIRAIWHLVWTWYQVACLQIYLRGAGHLSQHDVEMNIALLDHRPEVVHCVGHRTLGNSFSEQWTVFST